MARQGQGDGYVKLTAELEHKLYLLKNTAQYSMWAKAPTYPVSSVGRAQDF